MNRSLLNLLSLIMTVFLVIGCSKVTAADKAENPILGHTIIGSGPEKVIALHNFWSDQTEYMPMFAQLNKELFTYAFVDVRGYNKSREIKGEYTVDEIAGDVIALANHLKWEKFHLVGHSMTGMVVQRLAVDEPERIKSIIALTPVPAKGLQLGQGIVGWLNNAMKSQPAIQGYFNNNLKMYTKHYAKFHADRIWNNSTPEVRIAYIKMWTSEDFSDETKGLKIPIRVVLGTLDTSFNSSVRSFWEEWYPNSEVVECTATHFVTEEAPLCVISAIENFAVQHNN